MHDEEAAVADRARPQCDPHAGRLCAAQRLPFRPPLLCFCCCRGLPWRWLPLSLLLSLSLSPSPSLSLSLSPSLLLASQLRTCALALLARFFLGARNR